jgi:GDP-L-fucose synthase
LEGNQLIKSVVVFGSQGLVGKSLLRNAPSGLQVIGLSRANLDFTDRSKVLGILSKFRPDAVVLAGAKVSGIGGNSVNHRDFLVENLDIQNSVIMSAAKLEVENLIFLGSSCIYPKHASQPISESSLLSGPLEPTNEGYALAKIAGIKLVNAIYNQQGHNYFSLMPTNLYGLNDNFDPKSSHVPAALIRKFHEAKQRGDKEVVVWGTGKPKREFMHVDDLARACWHMLYHKAGGELLNVGTGKDLAVAEFAQLVAKVVGYEGNVIYDASRPDGTPRKLLDISKIHSYGWRHQIELEDGLSQTYDWFVEALKNGEVRGY